MQAAEQAHLANLAAQPSVALLAHLVRPEFHLLPRSYLLTIYVASSEVIAVPLVINHEGNDVKDALIASFGFGTFSVVV